MKPEQGQPEGGRPEGMKRKPPWLRKTLRLSPEVMKLRREIGALGLATICESARCPNLGECYCAGVATFLILGERCTRSCAFCAVGRGSPGGPDPGEGGRIARFMRAHAIRYAVITSVTRDDLPDGGAEHFARVVRDIRGELPPVGLELLVPDFRGDLDAVRTTARLPIQVFAHNMETVRELYPRIRSGADYGRSLRVLRAARGLAAVEVRLKSGVMVGLGETRGQLEGLFSDVAAAGVDILTIGQYLRPTGDNAPVIRYYSPEEFERLRILAENCGVRTVVAGPYVRSSYLAEQAFRGGTPVGPGPV
jgi:lipoic acid synthetase